MAMRVVVQVVAWLALLLPFAQLVRAPAAVAAPPSRIVSLNLCTDEILVRLVARNRIAALSHLASDPLVSTVVAEAAGIPSTRGEAENVLGLDPDLVLAGTFTTPATLDLLARVGKRVVRVPMASDFDGIRSALSLVGAEVGEPAAAEALIARLDASLSAAAADRPRPERRPTALIYQVNGLASGNGSIAGAIMAAAGFENHAGTLGLGAGGALPLELLVEQPPDLVILSGPPDEYRTVVADNLRHPAFRQLLAERPSVIIPWRLWLCGTESAGEAVLQLAKARRSLSPGMSR